MVQQRNSYTKLIIRSLFAALFIASFAFGGCTDDLSTVGSSFIPENERFQVKVDTSYDIDAYTVSQDSILTYNFIEGPLGVMTNRFLGRTTATIATELYPYYIDTALIRKTNVRSLDSVILILDVTKNIGLKGKPIKVNVYQLTRNLDTTKTYYSNQEVNDFNPSPIITFSLTKVEQKRIVLYPNGTLLGQNLGDSLIRATAEEMGSASVFREKFKGFYFGIDPTETDGAFYKINLFTTNSQIIVKYHITQKIAGVDKTEEASLPFYFYNKLGASHRFVSIKKDAAFADPVLYPKHINDTTKDAVKDAVVYSSSMGGVITFLNLKRLFEWKNRVFKDTSFIIHRAELVVEYENTTDTETDKFPKKIGLFTRSSVGKYEPIFDLALESNKLYGGTYNGLFQKGKMRYSANITRHLQSTLTESDTLSRIYLIPLAANQQPVDMNTSFFEDYSYGAFKGTANSSPIKLIITYSKLKK